jgi:holo-[acyl-carrier protein] synthase
LKAPARSSIGVDIVEIARLRRSSKKWGRHFLNKIYTARELAYAKSKRYPEQHLAARFAAKEAVFKALGEVEKEFVGWKNVEILNDPSGKPYLVWHGPAERARKKHGIRNAAVSLSHTENYAVATAMLHFASKRSR